MTVNGNKYSPSTGQAINGSTVNFEVIKGKGAMVGRRLYEGDTLQCCRETLIPLQLETFKRL